MPNSKHYMKEYMKEYNLTEKSRKYKNDYYQKNKERLKALQRKYYHKYKYDENKSHCLRKRLKLQKEYYKEKNPNSINYESHMKKNLIPSIKFNYGIFIIKFK